MKATRTDSTEEHCKPKATQHSWRDFRDQCHRQGPERCRGGPHHIPIQLAYFASAEDRWILVNVENIGSLTRW